jgi:hypothetical protein
MSFNYWTVYNVYSKQTELTRVYSFNHTTTNIILLRNVVILEYIFGLCNNFFFQFTIHIIKIYPVRVLTFYCMARIN